MSKRFELWGGISVSSTPEEIRALYPDSKGENPIELCSVQLCDCEFVASWKQLSDRNRLVQLDLARPLRVMDFRDVQQRLVALLSAKYGRGSAAIREDNLFQKRWDEEYVQIRLTCVDDANLPTACIEYFRPLGSEFDKI